VLKVKHFFYIPPVLVVWLDTISQLRAFTTALHPWRKKHEVLLLATKFEIMKECEETNVGLSESGNVTI
jgi:hypothetical protein